jgi:predicted anti-sigma-YlaC factor YlaD
MDCQRAQDEILESFIEPRPADVQAVLEAHLASCAMCTAFAEKQRAIDRRLASLLTPPIVSPRFRAAVHERVRHEQPIFWSDFLPDAVHFASCGVVTILGLVWLPLSASVVLTVAAAGTVLAHIVLTAMHDSLDAAEEAGL